MAAVTGKGYGKVILFGEHFVVYGLPGIAAGIDKYVEVKADKLKESDDVIFDDPQYFKEKVSLKENPEHIKFRGLVAMFKDEPEVPLHGIKLSYTGNLARGGLGFSAALGVAIVRALSNLNGLKWHDEKINEVAYKWEEVAHGTPSGIDNTCATYGTLVWFEKSIEGGKNHMRTLPCGKTLFLVIADTGVKRSTKEPVDKVRAWKEANSKEAEKIFSEAKKLAGKAKTALKFGEMEEIGKLMNQNQELLRKIGVSSPEIETLIKIALEKGAYGAKLTGAGCGGNIIALCENEAMQDKIVLAVEARGYTAIKTKIK